MSKSPHTSNPFTETTVTKWFVGREDQLNLFGSHLEGLRNKTPTHLYVAGVHGTGKTSYLKKLEEVAANEGFLAVSLTLDENRLAYEHIETIMRSVIKGLQNQFNKMGGQQSNSILKDWDKGKDSELFFFPRSEKLESNRMQDDFSKMSELMQEVGTSGCVICIDEGQRIDPRALSALKNSLQHLDSFLTVLSLRIITDISDPEASGRALLNEIAQKAEGDFGASRFFVTGIPLGPFDTMSEAVDCIKRRLENNALQFKDDVIYNLCEVTGRVPRDMISLASKVYNRAIKNQISVVEIKHFDETFQSEYQTRYQEALAIREGSSESLKTAIRGLLTLNQPVTPLAIVDNAYPNADAQLRSCLVDSIQGALDRLCKSSTLCHKDSDRFLISDNICAYSLKLAFEVERS